MTLIKINHHPSLGQLRQFAFSGLVVAGLLGAFL